MLAEFIEALSLVFIAEMGDKTQIIAMTFATQFTVKQVLAGVALGVIGNHSLAILLGSLLGTMLPLDIIQLLAGALFIFFGYNSLRSREDDEIYDKRSINPIMAVALAFFVGELGDKTQLTALALSAEALFPLVILLGTTASMITTSGIGILVGSRIGRRIPENALKAISSIVFVAFGLQKIYIGLLIQGISSLFATAALVILALIEIYMLFSFRKMAMSGQSKLPLKEAAQILYEKTARVKELVDDLCLGEGICGSCVGTGCLMGYTKDMLNKAKDQKNYYEIEGVDLAGLLRRDYDRNKVEGAYMMTLKELHGLNWPTDDKFVINRAREAFEVLLFGKAINLENSLSEQMEAVKSHDQVLFMKLKHYTKKEGLDEG